MTDIGNFPIPPMKQDRYLVMWAVRTRDVSEKEHGLNQGDEGMLTPWHLDRLSQTVRAWV
jgi:hypothetical protein